MRRPPFARSRLARGLLIAGILASVTAGAAQLPATIAAFTGQTATPSNTWASSSSWAKLWGTGTNAQSQLGTPTFRISPVLVANDADWAAVAGGDTHTCATKTTGTLFCWGLNTNG